MEENTYIETVTTFGNMPVAKFGHTATLVNKDKQIIFGGASGNVDTYSITNECFCQDIQNNPVSFTWRKLQNTGTIPCSRAAHACCKIEDNRQLLFGGATGAGGLAPDILYLMLLHKERAIWSEVDVVGESPTKRYGHTLTFTSPFVVLFGGNTGNVNMSDSWALNIDKQPFVWAKQDCKGDIPSPRVYHSADVCQSGAAAGMIVIFGGRRGEKQDSMNDEGCHGLRRHRDGKWDWVRAPYLGNGMKPRARYQHSGLFLGSLMFVVGGRTYNVHENLRLDIFDTDTSEWHSVNNLQRFRHVAWQTRGCLYVQGGFKQDSPDVPVSDVKKLDLLQTLQDKPNLVKKIRAFLNANAGSNPNSRDTTRSNSPMISRQGNQLGQGVGRNESHGNDYYNDADPNAMDEEKQIQFKLPQEKGNPGQDNKYISPQPLQHMEFQNVLLRPKNFVNYLEDGKFAFPPEKVISLAAQAEEIIKNQPIVLRFDSPAKIFGDIHGQYSDLMRFFDLWGTPYNLIDQEDGDIESFDYLFLGDFIDRGNHSLETICLLLALKIQYPTQIHLIRGNHEDRWINNTFGFFDECELRLNENSSDDYSVFNRMNRLFEYLPLSAIIDNNIICLHGGIGATLKRVDQIEKLTRPLDVVHDVETDKQRLVVDILWSDPTDNDQELGIHENVIRDPQGTGNIVKFGPDVVKEFQKENNLCKIIRAHECVMDGMERFAGGDLITVFSATDYCGKHKNAGAVLYMKKNFGITPKQIYPQNLSQSNWMDNDDAMNKRPPTPPRWRGKNNYGTNFEY